MIDNDHELRSIRLKADKVEDVDLDLIDNLYNKVDFIKNTMINDTS